MALAFPRVLPCGIATRDFTIARGTSANRMNGGATQVREWAAPRWQASFTSAPLRRREHQALEAWLDTARGGLRAFLAHDPLKPYPVAYTRAQFLTLSRAGGGAFDGTSTLLTYNTGTIGIGSLPVGLTLKAGDMVGLAPAGLYLLHRLAEDVVADALGRITVTVEPAVQVAWLAVGVPVTFVRPPCLMVLDPGSVSTPRTAGQTGAISFSAVQQVV